MFWGLIMEPQRRYTQQVKKAFHVSMAALDLATSSNEPAQVMCGFEGRNYLVCTLKKPDMLQCPLDLNFDVGSLVSFAANGKGHVHLTGYLTDELLDITGEEEAEDEEEEEVEVPRKTKVRNKKAVVENGPPSKKWKGSQVSSSQNQNEESESDDSDLDVKALLGTSLDDSDDDDSVVLEEEDEEVDDEDEAEEESGEEEEEESSLSDDESEEEKSEKVDKPKMNGVTKKQEQESKKQNKDKKKKEQQELENKKSPKAEQKKEVKTPSKENQTKTPRKKTLQGGVTVEDLKEGQGAPARGGKYVTVYYEGRIKQNNKVFDATTKGTGFSFRLGNGEVIKGWDIGLVGMKQGGKRRITCPPAMGYGSKGSPPTIPPNSTLVFEVELRKIS